MYNLEADLPEKFVPDDAHLDCTEIYGLKLRTKVAMSSFTRDNDLAGKDIRTVRVIDAAYMGIENYGLRTLAAGRYTSLEFTRSMKESVFIHELLRELRGRSEGASIAIDIDSLALEHAKHENKPFSSSNDKKAAYTGLACKVANEMRKWLPAPVTAPVDPGVLTLIKNLEAKITELTTGQQQAPPPPPPASTLASSFQRGSKREQLQVREEIDDDEQDSRHGGQAVKPLPIEEEAYQHLDRKNRPKVLAKTFPPGTKAQDVATWIKKLTLTAAKKHKLKLLTDSLITFHRNLPKIEQLTLDSISVEWGLPCKTAVHMSNDNLLKVIAAAITLSN